MVCANNMAASGSNIYDAPMKNVNICEYLNESGDDLDTYDSDKDPEYVPEGKSTLELADNQVQRDVADTIEAVPDSENGEDDDIDGNDGRSKLKGRKRLNHGSVQEQMKKKRNKGKEYKKYRGKGKIVEGKHVGTPCTCPKQCFQLINDEDKQNIFRYFWDMDCYNTQNAYLQGCLRSKSVCRKKTKHETSRRSQTLVYTVKSAGKDVIICKNAFLNIHGLQTHRGRVENIVKRLKNGAVSPAADGRGKHTNHRMKYATEDIGDVKAFIERLPRYKSHYCRKDSSREYLSMEYTIQLCYDRYVQEHMQVNKKVVSADKFRRIFTEDFNISFKSPKMDTCQLCDSLDVAIRHAENCKNETEVQSLHVKQELHHRKAEAGQSAIHEAIKVAKQNKNVHVITFDLQQTLPTPKLTTGPMFYKRKLWCYNFSIHSCGESQGHFFLWDEATAKRGSDEVASCLKMYFEKNDIKGDKLIAFSDNCAGQNKNWTLVSFWLYLLKSGRFKHIEHTFPQVGHSMLPSDRDFAKVEKNVTSHYQMVYGPDHWEEVLKTSQKKKPFKVTRMTQDFFYNFSALKQLFHQPQASGKQSKFSIRNCVRLVFSTESQQPFPTMMFCDTYSGSLETVSLSKRGRPASSISFLNELKTKYTAPLPIKADKFRDIISSLKWIPAVYHDWYNSLQAASNSAVSQGDEEEEEILV